MSDIDVNASSLLASAGGPRPEADAEALILTDLSGNRWDKKEWLQMGGTDREWNLLASLRNAEAEHDGANARAERAEAERDVLRKALQDAWACMPTVVSWTQISAN